MHGGIECTNVPMLAAGTPAAAADVICGYKFYIRQMEGRTPPSFWD